MFLFEKFVSFNDCQEECAPVRRVTKILNNTIKRFYSDKDDQINNIKYDNEIKSKNSRHEVIIPFDIFTSKFQDDINLLMTTSKFRSIYTNKIDKNIDLINKMLYEENKDITYISRWIRIAAKLFIKQWIGIFFGLRTEEMNK